MNYDSNETALQECTGTDTKNQKVSEAAQVRFASKSCLLSSSTTIDEVLACLNVSGPTAILFFSTLLLWVVEHIPDDYRNSATTFMIAIIMTITSL